MEQMRWCMSHERVVVPASVTASEERGSTTPRHDSRSVERIVRGPDTLQDGGECSTPPSSSTDSNEGCYASSALVTCMGSPTKQSSAESKPLAGIKPSHPKPLLKCKLKGRDTRSSLGAPHLTDTHQDPQAYNIRSKVLKNGSLVTRETGQPDGPYPVETLEHERERKAGVGVPTQTTSFEKRSDGEGLGLLVECGHCSGSHNEIPSIEGARCREGAQGLSSSPCAERDPEPRGPPKIKAIRAGKSQLGDAIIDPPRINQHSHNSSSGPFLGGGIARGSSDGKIADTCRNEPKQDMGQISVLGEDNLTGTAALQAPDVQEKIVPPSAWSTRRTIGREAMRDPGCRTETEPVTTSVDDGGHDASSEGRAHTETLTERTDRGRRQGEVATEDMSAVVSSTRRGDELFNRTPGGWGRELAGSARDEERAAGEEGASSSRSAGKRVRFSRENLCTVHEIRASFETHELDELFYSAAELDQMQQETENERACDYEALPGLGEERETEWATSGTMEREVGNATRGELEGKVWRHDIFSDRGSSDEDF